MPKHYIFHAMLNGIEDLAGKSMSAVAIFASMEPPFSTLSAWFETSDTNYGCGAIVSRHCRVVDRRYLRQSSWQADIVATAGRFWTYTMVFEGARGSLASC